MQRFYKAKKLKLHEDTKLGRYKSDKNSIRSCTQVKSSQYT